jgi:hypothetical protein
VKEILITDWSTAIPVVDSLKETINDNRVSIFRVENRDYAWLSKMKNLVGDSATTDLIFFLDPFIWLRKFDFVPDAGVFYHGAGQAKSSCLIHSLAYFKTNGYNEFYITSIGANDDFYERLKKKDYIGEIMPEGMEHIDHNSSIATPVRVKEPNVGKVWSRGCVKNIIEYTVQKLAE